MTLLMKESDRNSLLLLLMKERGKKGKQGRGGGANRGRKGGQRGRKGKGEEERTGERGMEDMGKERELKVLSSGKPLMLYLVARLSESVLLEAYWTSFACSMNDA